MNTTSGADPQSARPGTHARIRRTCQQYAPPSPTVSCAHAPSTRQDNSWEEGFVLPLLRFDLAYISVSVSANSSTPVRPSVRPFLSNSTTLFLTDADRKALRRGKDGAVGWRMGRGQRADVDGKAGRLVEGLQWNLQEAVGWG